MQLNHIKIAWRNFRKDRQFVFLNLMSLFTCLLYLGLVYLSLNDTRKADKVYKDDVRSYRLIALPLVDGIQTIKDEHTTSVAQAY